MVVTIGWIDLSALGDELTFERVLTDPLRELYASGYSESILLLADALDEALGYSGDVTIPDLLSRFVNLPSQVRILATTRDDPRALKFFRGIKPFDLTRDAAPENDDVRDYVLGRLKPLNAMSDLVRMQIADGLVTQGRGNFLYATVVLDELLTRLPQISDLETFPDLETYPLPKGLGGLYRAFLKRELGTEERGRRWHQTYKPLLGLIAVAQRDGLTAQQLTDMIGEDIRPALRVTKQYLSGELPDGPFRLFHESFADFLLENEDNGDYHIDAEAMHRRIAEYYLEKLE